MKKLTPRQLELVALAAEGLSYKEIARKLWISTHTVNRTFKDARKRVGARNNPHLVAIVLRSGELASER